MADNKYPVDPAELEPEYSEHLKTIAGDWPPPLLWQGGYVQIHRSKVENAATQLALRDREIARLNRELDDYDVCRGSVLRKNLESERDAALARVRELEARLKSEATAFSLLGDGMEILRARIRELTEGDWIGRAEEAERLAERGWQWRPTDADTAFAPPFGTIRQCRVCGCLVAGGPTACVRCAMEGEADEREERDL